MEDADRLPIAEDEVDDLGRCRQQPGEGVQQVQRRDRVEMRKDRVDPDHAEHTGAQNHNDGRADGFSQPARGGDRAVHKGGDAVGKPHDHNALHAGVDDSAFGCEERQKLAAE